MDLTKDNLDLKNPEKPIYLWKYVDLHRLIYFLSNGKLFFNRLDKFNDPIEGIKSSILRTEALIGPQMEESDINQSIPEDERKKIYENAREFHELRKKETLLLQTTQFVNCWFCGNRESMAMWDLYSNKDSVAIKINSSTLIDSLKPSFEQLIYDRNRQIGVASDLIKYMKLNPFDLSNDKINIKYGAMKKDICFGHEREYRFLITIAESLLRQNIVKFEVKITDFKTQDFTIVTHPLMEEWQVNNIGTLIQIYQLPFSLKKAETALRR